MFLVSAVCSFFNYFLLPFQGKLLAIFSPSLALAVMLGDSNIIRWDFYRPSKANKIINVAVQIIAIIAGQAKKKKSFQLRLTNPNVIRVYTFFFPSYLFLAFFFFFLHRDIFILSQLSTDFFFIEIFQCIDSAFWEIETHIL